MKSRRVPKLLICWLSLLPAGAFAAEAIVAVATNFADVARELESMFEESSGHRLTITSGSTGKLFAQIMQGAPFEVFLAADRERPRLLEVSGEAVHDTRFTYAIGCLVLWSPDTRRVFANNWSALQPQRFTTLAIANPDLAPYGKAAKQTLQALGLWDSLQDKIVFGENVGQTFSYVVTRNAELGFVSLAQVISPHNLQRGSYREVLAELHEPIRQQAVLLRSGSDNPAAFGFMAFLRSPPAQALIEASGYRIN